MKMKMKKKTKTARARAELPFDAAAGDGNTPAPFQKGSPLSSQLPTLPMSAANDLRKGMAIRYNGNPAIVLEVQHRTPGNLRAFVQVIVRYIGTGKSADIRFSSTEKVDLVDVNRQELEFSYSDPQGFHFMDPETYETITL